jgi:hypothetical protein
LDIEVVGLELLVVPLGVGLRIEDRYLQEFAFGGEGQSGTERLLARPAGQSDSADGDSTDEPCGDQNRHEAASGKAAASRRANSITSGAWGVHDPGEHVLAAPGGNGSDRVVGGCGVQAADEIECLIGHDSSPRGFAGEASWSTELFWPAMSRSRRRRARYSRTPTALLEQPSAVAS